MSVVKEISSFVPWGGVFRDGLLISSHWTHAKAPRITLIQSSTYRRLAIPATIHIDHLLVLRRNILMSLLIQANG